MRQRGGVVVVGACMFGRGVGLKVRICMDGCG